MFGKKKKKDEAPEAEGEAVDETSTSRSRIPARASIPRPEPVRRRKSLRESKARWGEEMRWGVMVDLGGSSVGS